MIISLNNDDIRKKNMFKYCVVIVTYNRLTLLKECLEHVMQQSVAPYAVVVIDNCSTDGTAEYLDRYSANRKCNFYVRHTNENIGGAGGFNLGLREGVKNTDAEWFMLIDDDAILDYDCMRLMDPSTAVNQSLAYACSVYVKGQIDLSHRILKNNDVDETYYQK